MLWTLLSKLSSELTVTSQVLLNANILSNGYKNNNKQILFNVVRHKYSIRELFFFQKAYTSPSHTKSNDSPS